MRDPDIFIDASRLRRSTAQATFQAASLVECGVGKFYAMFSWSCFYLMMLWVRLCSLSILFTWSLDSLYDVNIMRLTVSSFFYRTESHGHEKE